MTLYKGIQKVCPIVTIKPTLTTKNITQNGTYNASSDNADGYSSVTVNVSGGGSSVNYAVTTDGFILPIGAAYNETYNETTAITSVTISAAYTSSYIDCLPYDLQILSSDKNMDVSMRSIFLKYLVFALTEIAKSKIFEDAYAYNENLEKVDFSSLQTISGSNVFMGTFVDCTKLSEIKFDNLQTISGSTCFISRPFKGTAIINISFPKLSILTGRYALGGSAGIGGAFANCTSLQTLSFPALTSTSFGSYTNQFNYMLNGVTGCTVHFPSNLQSVIGSWSSVTSGFGGTNTTVLFDLPATT